MQSQKILVVDDESSVRSALFRIFDRKGYSVITASTKAEAESFCNGNQSLDLAMVDLRLPDGDGIELMKFLKTIYPEIQVIILTGYGSIETAISATQNGAFHFITKPFNIEELTSLAEKALKQKDLQVENTLLKTELKTKYRFNNIIGQSKEIKNVLDLIARVSDSDSNILITGESGTGKELVAKAIHYNSPRSTEPFVPINCGAIPSELLESELFGHIKGAFTGAINNRVGRFEVANGGTLLLDEIGDLDILLQVKLLRVLQERRFEPVGSTKSMDADVRVIAATNMDLEQAVLDNKFREDLYYRLNVIPIHIPSLKERQTDIPLLLHHFMEKFNRTKNRNITGFSSEALELLYGYAWPGNIRELENLVERLSILKGSGQIQVTDLPIKYRAASESIKDTSPSQAVTATTPELESVSDDLDFNSAVDAYENRLILRALEKTGWNRNQAAMLLKLNRTTLVEKIKKKGLRPPEITA